MLLSFVLFSPKQFSNILDFPCSQFPLYLLAAFFTSLHSFLNSFYLCLFCCLSYFLSLFSFTSLSLDSLFHFFSTFLPLDYYYWAGSFKHRLTQDCHLEQCYSSYRPRLGTGPRRFGYRAADGHSTLISVQYLNIIIIIIFVFQISGCQTAP